MNAKRLTTREASRAQAVGRRRVAEKYEEIARLVATEDGTAINVSIGLAVLAGIAAGDAICIAATGQRYSGSKHAEAADLLGRVDRQLGSKLRDLVDLKPGSHYGDDLLTSTQRTRALRAAEDLVAAARQRTT